MDPQQYEPVVTTAAPSWAPTPIPAVPTPTPTVPTPTPIVFEDPREKDKYVSDLPDAFFLDEDCLERIAFSCVDFDEDRRSFVYLYQYTYADNTYKRLKADYDKLSAAIRKDQDEPKSSVMLTVFASYNYESRQVKEFYRSFTPAGGVSAYARKPPDLDGYTLYFEKKLYFYTRDGDLAFEADCTWAYDQ
jgi:hypothetical protein